MKISIITINYNNIKGLKKTFESVLNQSDSDFEYVVIDGGSSDGSLDIIIKNESKINYWVSEKDAGIYDAMNKGIAHATGDYFIFMNSGDCFYDEQVIKTYKEYVNNFPDIDIFYANILVVNDEKPSENWVNNFPSKLNLEFFKKRVINHQATLIKSVLFNQFGNFPLKYKLASDYWFWIICLFNRKKLKHIDRIMVKYDNSGISATNFSNYASEMEIIWQSIVPEAVQDVVLENEQYKRLTEFRLVKIAIGLHEKYQSFKQKK